MRRKSRMKTLKVLRLFAQARIIVFVQLTIYYCIMMETMIMGQPGFLDFDNLPDTNFSCAGKVIGGYYADLETSCQMFHVCTIGQLEEPMDIKFLCLNGTVFDQETRVCERVEEVDCTKSEQFFYLNLELYGNTIEPNTEDGSDMHVKATTQSTTTTTASYARTKSTTISPPITVRPVDILHHSMKTTTYRAPTYKSPHISINAMKKESLINIKNNTNSNYNSNNNNTNGMIVAVTKNPPSNLQLSSTTTLKSQLIEDDHPIESSVEYEYEDDYPTTDNKHLYQDYYGSVPIIKKVDNMKMYHQPDKTTVSPDEEDEDKPAISFQQQQFKNGDTLSLTNAHITVTTHYSTPSRSKNHNYSTKPNSNSTHIDSSIMKTALTNPSDDIDTDSSNNSQIGNVAVTPLPSNHQQSYPQPNQQVILPKFTFHPTSNDRSTKIIPYLLQPQPFQLTEKKNQPIYRKPVTPTIVFDEDIANFERHHSHLNYDSYKLTDRNLSNRDKKNIPPTTNRNRSNAPINSATTTQRSTITSSSEPNSNRYHSNYERILLTPQHQYIPTLPKVIVTASASVSDASGKKLNYSLGNVIGTKTIKSLPITSDEYTDDVIFDPLFLDVPKITAHRSNRTYK